ncbi:hypothetical protein [Streptomyces sp. Root1310]|uniref:hypothetical protein n=1 Tax=Streptomyces sp. Root1310 TaxID=1736452 RepID=UPI00070BEF8E|nr:hypothetical protein [Streptomyces sp. Root1310]KQX78539.1 hypothetical protein ASD48_35080 [Streptomyces sp. Root1310]
MSDHSAVILLACALVILTGVLVAVAAGCLARRDRASYPASITRAAAAFTGTLTLAGALVTAITTVTQR